MLRDLINLIEDARHSPHVWYHCTRKEASTIIDDHHITLIPSDFGPSIFLVESPEIDSDEIILEFSLDEDYRILDLADRRDVGVWNHHRHEKQHPRQLVTAGIDGLYDPAGEGFHIFNPEALTFIRVYDGVVSDPLEETNVNLLDEYALGGLARCTAVTVNAILEHFHRRPITLAEVPINEPGVMRILVARGLAYRPFPNEVGRSLQQFSTIHHLGAWCLITKGHAMALVDGRLFDAENKLPDARKLIAAYQMQQR